METLWGNMAGDIPRRDVLVNVPKNHPGDIPVRDVTQNISTRTLQVTFQPEMSLAMSHGNVTGDIPDGNVLRNISENLSRNIPVGNVTRNLAGGHCRRHPRLECHLQCLKRPCGRHFFLWCFNTMFFQFGVKKTDCATLSSLVVPSQCTRRRHFWRRPETECGSLICVLGTPLGRADVGSGLVWVWAEGQGRVRGLGGA